MVDEDLEPLITRCPNCSTQFRVTENQLAAAGGRVRCGACLTVFEGTEHLLLDEDSTFTDGSEADAALDALLDELGTADVQDAAAAVSDRYDEPEQPDDDLVPDTSAVEAVQLYGGYEDEPTQEVELVSAAEEAEPGSADTAPEAPGPEPVAAEPEPVSVPDTGAETPEPVVAENAAESDAQEEPEAEDRASGGLGPFTVVEHSGRDPDYEAWIRPGTGNLDQLVDEVVASGTPLPDTNTETDAGGDTEAAAKADSEPAPAADTAVPGFHLSAVESALAEEGVATGPIHFGPEPRRWWVGGAAAVLALMLLGQIFYLKLPDWSRDPGMRSAYESVCGLTGCELPDIRDLDALRTRNLMVRSHPDLQNALVIDAVIVNTAGFPQPYPDLELRFTSVGGLLVAGRRFEPAEYLAGEAAQDRLMPVDTPVQVTIEIADPGDEAVNYALNFR